MTSFGPALENAALKALILDESERAGRLTFARFMELALYHPKHGYYNSRREKMGRGGDYVTSPEVHPIFGALVGRQLRQMWQMMDRLQQFDIVEVGAGTGAFARDILSAAGRDSSEFAAALRYHIVERNDRQREIQEETLVDGGVDGSSITWSVDLPEGIHGCIISNELFDALPVHLVTTHDGTLREIYVVRHGDDFEEVIAEPSTPDLSAYFQRLGLAPGEGSRAEVSLGAPALIREFASHLASGFVATFDYGYLAPDLYASWRRQGTLMCFYRHGYTDNPFAHIGRQDITAHVDFTTLMDAGAESGLRTLAFLRQAEFLSHLGISQALTPPAGRDFEEYAARRRAVLELTEITGLGRIQVLIQSNLTSDEPLLGSGSGEMS